MCRMEKKRVVDFMFQLDKEDVEILKSQTAVEVNIRRLISQCTNCFILFLKYIFLNIQNNEKPCNFVPGKWESNR